MGSDQERLERYLKQAAPLAPFCLRYLDSSTLGKTDRVGLRDAFKNIFQVSPEHDFTPRYSSNRLTDTLDNITVNIIHTAIVNGHITNHDLQVIRGNEYTGITLRNYVLMKLALDGVTTNIGISRQFAGMHVVISETDEITRLPELDLSTDYLYIRYAALMRYVVILTDNNSYAAVNKLFNTIITQGDSDTSFIFPTKVRELIWDNPEQADRLARFVAERETHDIKILREALDDCPLGDGIL